LMALMVLIGLMVLMALMTLMALVVRREECIAGPLVGMCRARSGRRE
jgi:hypothetical protein